MSIKRFNGAGISGTKSIKMWDQVTTQNDYQSIATVIVPSGGLSTITFSNIPQNFTHLKLHLNTKDDSTGTGGPNIVMQLGNGTLDTTYTHYWSHYFNGNGSAASAGNVQSSGYYSLVGNHATSNSSYTGMFGGMIIDILEYTSTTKNKVVKSLWGHDRNGTGEIGINSSIWTATSVAGVTAISFSIVGGANFVQFSQASLYGIKVSS